MKKYLYHATYVKHKRSILKHGLGGKIKSKNFDFCDNSVYLADDPILAFTFLLEPAYKEDPNVRIDNKLLSKICVLKIQRSTLKRSKLRLDQNLKRHGFYQYGEIIPINQNVEILKMTEVLQEELAARNSR